MAWPNRRLSTGGLAEPKTYFFISTVDLDRTKALAPTTEPASPGRTEDMEPYEAVYQSGDRYFVPRHLARAFAAHMKLGNQQDFPRAVDPAHNAHHIAEGWQGAYHVRFLEKLDAAGSVAAALSSFGVSPSIACGGITITSDRDGQSSVTSASI